MNNTDNLSLVFTLIGIVFFIGWVILAYLNGKLFCSHKWEVKQTTTQSILEQYKSNGITPPSPTDVLGTKALTEKHHITIMYCKTCGKVKRYVSTI